MIQKPQLQWDDDACYVPQWSFWVSCTSFWYPTTRSLKLDQGLLFYSKYDRCRSYLFISKECCCCCLSWCICIRFMLYAHNERWHLYTLLEALVHIRQLSSTHLLLGDTWLSYTVKDYMICYLEDVLGKDNAQQKISINPWAIPIVLNETLSKWKQRLLLYFFNWIHLYTHGAWFYEVVRLWKALQNLGHLQHAAVSLRS